MEDKAVDVLVAGSAGRTGRAVVAGVLQDRGTRLVGAVDPGAVGRDAGIAAGVGACGVITGGSLETAVIQLKPDVVIDFTLPDVTAHNISVSLKNGCHVVVGTTGLTEEAIGVIRSEAATSGRNVIIAPNFSLGAVLMIELSKIAARHFGTVEIIERHHDGKKDSPSGTALRTASLLAKAINMKAGREALDGNGRGHGVDGVKVHAVRLPGLCAHQEVVFGGPGETLTVRHDTIGRECYVPGVLLAVRRVATVPGVIVGMEHLLF